jgi:hypothetical protein
MSNETRGVEGRSFRTKRISNSMRQNPLQGDISLSVIENISTILINPKVS